MIVQAEPILFDNDCYGSTLPLSFQARPDTQVQSLDCDKRPLIKFATYAWIQANLQMRVIIDTGAPSSGGVHAS